MNSNSCIIDIGEYEVLREFIHREKIIVDKIFLTHGHYDHIFGLKSFIEDFPHCVIYGHEYTIECVKNDKLNLSFYYNIDLQIKKFQFIKINSFDNIEIFKDSFLKAYLTPGHNAGSITFKNGNNIFTGDSYIPFTPVVTKLKTGNKDLNLNSLELIRSLINPESIIHPGHGDRFFGYEVLTYDNIININN